MVQQIEEGIWIGKESEAVITEASSYASIERGRDTGPVKRVWVGKEQADIRLWGQYNNLPQLREELICDNNIVGALLGTKRDITIGNGLMAYRERFEDGKIIKEPIEMPAQIADFLEFIDWDEYAMTASKNFFLHANIMTEFVRNKAKGIYSIKAHECKYVRAEKMRKNARINNWYYSTAWARKIKDDRRTGAIKVPAYNKRLQQRKFMLRTGDNLLGDEYYYCPSWWGSRIWVKLANCIPEFHFYNMKHGYTIRWHIEIPKGYFSKKPTSQLTPEALKNAKTATTSAKQNFISEMNKFLAGLKNTGRAVFTDYEINKALGKEFPGIKITPLTVDLKDEALLTLFEKSNQANISAQAIHPTLAAVETAGKLSSGSEIRNAFLMYVAIKTPLPRKIMLKVLDIVKKDNNWDKNVKLGFKDIEITKLDENKSGNQNIAAT